MRELRKHEKAAIQAVARHFSATWEKGENPPDAYLIIARKRIAVEITALKQPIAGLTKPRLRFDRVALGLMRRLRATLSESVPAGRTLIVTVTAPIWQPSKTAAALEEIVRRCLASRSPKFEVEDSVHGNRVRVRLMKGGPRRGSNVIGFVHNPDPNIGAFLDITQSLIAGIGAKADRRPPESFTGDRWLVVADEDGPSPIETYRQVCAQLAMSTGFKKILMVLAGGRVETLAG